MDAIAEKRRGLCSVFTFRCNVCQYEQNISTEGPNNAESYMDVNTAAVSAALTTGGGYAQIEELAAVLDMPFMAKKTYKRHHEKVGKTMRETALSSMLAAGREELQLAIEAGRVDEDGNGLITVVADGAWSKRSYGTNYNAASGVAVIVGFHTRKILYVGIKNKYCSFCTYHSKKKTNPTPAHNCARNWAASSTSMEAASIVEGFNISIEMHSLKYVHLIADGDSSVHRKLVDALPYGPDLLVAKIECRNHLLRGYIRRLRALSINSKAGTVQQRSHLRQNMKRLRYAVTRAIAKRKVKKTPEHENVQGLHKDIINGPRHVFGDHSECAEYFCDGAAKLGEENAVPDMLLTGLFQEIASAAALLAHNSTSLIKDVDNNAAEHYNSYVAKTVGGKRVDFSRGDSYEVRCNAAVVSFNAGGELHRVVHKTMLSKSPGFYTGKYAKRCRTAIAKNKTRRLDMSNEQRYAKPRASVQTPRLADEDYGPNAANPEPDMSDDELERAKAAYLVANALDDAGREQIERDTRGQSSSANWHNIRRRILTASKFAKVCNLRPTTSCGATVAEIRYGGFHGNRDTKWGVEKESVAIAAFSQLHNVQVQECGLFIDAEHSFLGASPDGLVGDDCVVEVKCLSSAKDMTIEEGIIARKITCLSILADKTMAIKPRDKFMFQIQGQLHITKRQYCYFIVWTPKDMFVQKIVKDDVFWREMEPKLVRFYMNCLLPEIIDSRKSRNQPIRDPDYILEAKKLAEGKSVKIANAAARKLAKKTAST